MHLLALGFRSSYLQSGESLLAEAMFPADIALALGQRPLLSYYDKIEAP